MKEFLQHFSHEPLPPLAPRRIPGCVQVKGSSQVLVADKPVGFWLSVEGPASWPEWCIAESYALGSWYYTWDCASGCIWDVEAIESVKAIDFDFGEAA